MYRPNVIILIATIMIVLGVALAVPFIVGPGPEIVVKEEDYILNNIDQIPNMIFPHLSEKSLPLYEFWREVCHLFVTCTLMGISFYFFRYKKKWYVPVVMFGVLLIWITVQEAYIHPKYYQQEVWNGLLDWFVWIIPFAVFLFLIYRPRKRIPAFH